MSLISEQVEELRHESKMFHKTSKLYKLLSNAADTIEELSAKLSSANIERSEQHYDNDMVKVIRCKDCMHWGRSAMEKSMSLSAKVCEYGGYMVGENGYCVYGEKK